jgi:hypothetical protein
LTLDNAKAKAKRMNANLSPGEKKHYGLKYIVVPVKGGKFIKESVELNEDGFHTALIEEIKKLKQKIGIKGTVTDNGPSGIMLIQKEDEYVYQYDWDLKTKEVYVSIFIRGKFKTQEDKGKASSANDFLNIIKN